MHKHLSCIFTFLSPNYPSRKRCWTAICSLCSMFSLTARFGNKSPVCLNFNLANLKGISFDIFGTSVYLNFIFLCIFYYLSMPHLLDWKLKTCPEIISSSSRSFGSSLADLVSNNDITMGSDSNNQTRLVFVYIIFAPFSSCFFFIFLTFFFTFCKTISLPCF